MVRALARATASAHGLAADLALAPWGPARKEVA